MARRKNRATGKQKAKSKPKVKGPKTTPPKGRPTASRRGGPLGGRRRWTQPGWLALLAALAGLVCVVLLIGSVAAAVSVRGMADAPACPSAGSDTTDCLLEVPGRLEGSRDGRREAGRTWQFAPTDDRRGSESVKVLGTGNTTLEGWSGEVVGLYWHDRLVAFEDPATGRRVESERFGMTMPATLMLGGVVALAVALTLVRAARIQRAALNGRWWGVTGDVPRPPAGGPLTLLPVVLGAPALTGFVALTTGVGVNWSFAIALAALAVLLAWREFRRRRRSSAQTARSSASMIR